MYTNYIPEDYKIETPVLKDVLPNFYLSENYGWLLYCISVHTA